MEDNKIIKFDMFKLERNKAKICNCNPPQITVDTVNRRCECTICGTVLDGFDAMVKLLEYIEDLYRALDNIKNHADYLEEKANEAKKRYFKNKAFKDMDEHYKSNMLPFCPNCNEQFDPMKINRWARNDIKMR